MGTRAPTVFHIRLSASSQDLQPIPHSGLDLAYRPAAVMIMVATAPTMAMVRDVLATISTTSPLAGPESDGHDPWSADRSDHDSGKKPRTHFFIGDDGSDDDGCRHQFPKVPPWPFGGHKDAYVDSGNVADIAERLYGIELEVSRLSSMIESVASGLVVLSNRELAKIDAIFEPVQVSTNQPMAILSSLDFRDELLHSYAVFFWSRLAAGLRARETPDIGMRIFLNEKDFE